MLNEKTKERIEHLEIVFQERSLTKLASNKRLSLANRFSKTEKSFQELEQFKSLAPGLYHVVIDTDGCVVYGGTGSEVKSKNYRRSLYVADEMKAGDVFTGDNFRIVRTGLGYHQNIMKCC